MIIYNQIQDLFNQALGFDWDLGNIDKNLFKHKVTNQECEEAFLDLNAFVTADVFHSTVEPRYQLLARNKKRYLTIYFTHRKNKIRVISARDMNKKEKKQYESI